jgi:hypothetical protein
MAAGRYVVLGLAPARSAWFRQVAQWSHSAATPIEFVRCMSVVELRAHLASGRAFSALLVDGGTRGLDRDLIELAREAGCAVVVVDDVKVTRDWVGLGAGAVINPVFEVHDLLEVLAGHAAEVRVGNEVPDGEADEPLSPWRARVAAVCGPGGTGASTLAVALAQGLCDDLAFGGMVLLADLALHADQAMLHDARDVVPGLQELVDAHRTGRPRLEDLRNFTYDVEARGYQLLLGLRRSRNWSSVRPRAFGAAFESMLRGWRAVVCDTDADLEGEADGGSADVEERHLLARTATARADVVFAVGLPGLKGVHGLVRVVGELLDHDVPAARIIPVCNRAPRSARGRAEVTAAVATLLQGRPEAATLATPIFVPERDVDELLFDGVRLPSVMTAPLAGAFNAVVASTAPRWESDDEPQLVAPGSLGHWSPDVEAGLA